MCLKGEEGEEYYFIMIFRTQIVLSFLSTEIFIMIIALKHSGRVEKLIGSQKPRAMETRTEKLRKNRMALYQCSNRDVK